MICKKLKITVEQTPFQREKETGWKREKANFRRTAKHFPCKIDNYIVKRAELPLHKRIVKSKSFMIPTDGQAIPVTQKQLWHLLGELQHEKKLLHFSFGMGLTTMLRTTYKKCDRSQRQNSLPPNMKYEMHSVPVSSDLMKQVDLCLCSLLELDGYHHLLVCINYFTKWLEAKPITDKRV